MLNLVPVIIMVFLLATLLKVSFMYYVFYLLAVVFITSRFWARAAARNLRAERRYESRAFLGEDVGVTVTVTNHGLLPLPWIRLTDRLPPALATPSRFERVITLGPRASQSFAFTLHGRQRGYHPVGPLDAEFGDALGIGDGAGRLLPEVFLTVYPRIMPLDQLGLPSRAPFGDLRSTQPLYQDPSRVNGVRDYQVGDSLRSVHWRTSASLGRLQVKTQDAAMTLQTVIFLNMNVHEFDRQGAYYAVELGVVVAASLASHLSTLRQEIGLVTNARDARDKGRLPSLAARKGHEQLMHVLELLARAEPVDDAPPFVGLIDEVATHLPWGATVVLVVGQEGDDLVNRALTLRRAGFSVVIVFVAVASRYRDGSRLATLGFRTFNIWREEDFDVWRRANTAQHVGA